MLEMTVAVTSMSVDAVTGSMPSGMGRSWPAGTMAPLGVCLVGRADGDHMHVLSLPQG